MKLGMRVTLFFLASILCVNLLVLIGLPFFFSELIKGQMESHARTYVAFIKKEIETCLPTTASLSATRRVRRSTKPWFLNFDPRSP